MPDYTILLIDYDPKSIDKMRRSLTDAGYGFELAKNGVEGLDLFKRLKPSMVLVEAMLPKKHGFEVCSEIKNTPEGVDVPVVIITAVYRGRKYRSQAFHMYKCDEYLEKPLSDEKLLATVQKFLPGSPKKAEAPQTPAKAEPPTPEPPKPVESPTATSPPPSTEATPEEVAKPSGSPTPPAAEPVASAPAGAQRTAPAANKGNGAASTASDADDDESVADFTEDDIMSALDAIMPDEKPVKPAKSASG